MGLEVVQWGYWNHRRDCDSAAPNDLGYHCTGHLCHVPRSAGFDSGGAGNYRCVSRRRLGVRRIRRGEYYFWFDFDYECGGGGCNCAAVGAGCVCAGRRGDWGVSGVAGEKVAGRVTRKSTAEYAERAEKYGGDCTTKYRPEGVFCDMQCNALLQCNTLPHR